MLEFFLKTLWRLYACRLTILFLYGCSLLNKDPKVPTFSSIDWSIPPNTSSHFIHLTITREHGLETNKENRDEDVNKGDDQITKPVSATSPTPSPMEDQDSDDCDEVDDSTRGLTTFNREKLDALSKDSEDAPTENDKDFKDV